MSARQPAAVSFFPAPVRAFIRKELREYRHHRSIILTALGLPAVFMLLPVLYLLSLEPDVTRDDLDMAMGQAMFTFFLAPVIVPAAMAAYSVIGEKEQGTLEPILTLPLTDHQFIHAKMIAIAGPAALIAAGVYVGFAILGALAFAGPVREEALGPIWGAGILIMTLPLALYSTLVGMIISARAKDLRVAEQLAGLIILPTLVPISLVTFQVIPLSPFTWLGFAGVVLTVDALLLALTYRTFQRERVLAYAT